MGILEIGGISIAVAFLAGLLSVASPCLLPMVPAYLGYLTGAALEGQPQTAAAASTAGGGGGLVAVAVPAGGGSAVVAPSPFLHSLSFVSGFSLVFILFGIS
ncbi:MAG: cytochrome c biogenesis protein CcdA, partial [Dehalococcoidia bacterium]